MAIRVLIKRHIKKGRVEQAIEMLKELRKMALNQQGYISGETLICSGQEKTDTGLSRLWFG